jgi:hypothetical protein
LLDSESVQLILLLQLKLPLSIDALQAMRQQGRRHGPGALVEQQQLPTLCLLQCLLLALLLAIELPLGALPRPRTMGRTLHTPQLLLACPVQLHQLGQAARRRIGRDRQHNRQGTAYDE